MAWALLNQRFKQLENFLQGLTGFALGQRESTSGATPLVERVGGLIVRNSGSTTITAFVGGEPGQSLVVLAQDALTTIAHGPTLRMSENTDWVTRIGETRHFWTPDGATWYEVPRTLATIAVDTLATSGGDDIVTDAGDFIEVSA